MRQNKKRFVITGMGPIGSVGIGKEAFWRGILEQKVNVELVKSFAGREIWEQYYAHKVQDFDITRFDLNKDDLVYISNWKDGEDNRDLLFLMAAIKLALDDGRIDYKSGNNNLGLIVTHENPGIEQLLWKSFKSSYSLLKNNQSLNEKDYYNEFYKKTVKVGYETQSFMLLFHIARMFHIHEYSLFVNNACSSGLFALEAAKDMIALGKAKQVIVVAGDCPDIFKHLWFKMINMYASDGKIKPFDKNANGFIMGEGATAFILEDYEHAEKRKAHIYAEYLGGGFKLEGWGITTPMIGGKFYHEVIEEALSKSDIDEREVDLICAHGVGIPANDYYESKAICDTFTDKQISVTALKPYVGHNLGGCTLLELAILCLMMEKAISIPVLNTKQLDPKITINLVKEQKDIHAKTVLKISSAFAGYDAAVVLQKVR